MMNDEWSDLTKSPVGWAGILPADYRLTTCLPTYLTVIAFDGDSLPFLEARPQAQTLPIL